MTSPSQTPEAAGLEVVRGVFIKSWEVHCAGCERALLGVGRRQWVKAAAREARAAGWGLRGGLWHCPACGARKDSEGDGRPRRWTHDEDVVLAEKGVHACATELSISVGRARSRAKYLGLETKALLTIARKKAIEKATAGGHAAGLTCRETARRAGVHPSTILRTAHRLGLVFKRPRDCMRCGGRADVADASPAD